MASNRGSPMSDDAVLSLIRSRFDSTDKRLAALDTKIGHLATNGRGLGEKVETLSMALAEQASVVPRVNIMWAVGKWFSVFVGGTSIIAVGAAIIYWAGWK